MYTAYVHVNLYRVRYDVSMMFHVKIISKRAALNFIHILQV